MSSVKQMSSATCQVSSCCVVVPPVEDADHQKAEGEAVPLQHALDVLLEAAADVDEPDDHDNEGDGDNADDDDDD